MTCSTHDQYVSVSLSTHTRQKSVSSSMLKQHLAMSLKHLSLSLSLKHLSLKQPTEPVDGNEHGTALPTADSLEQGGGTMSSGTEQHLLDTLGMEEGGKSQFFEQPELKVDVVRCADWSGDASALPSLAGQWHHASSLCGTIRAMDQLFALLLFAICKLSVQSSRCCACAARRYVAVASCLLRDAGCWMVMLDDLGTR